GLGPQDARGAAGDLRLRRLVAAVGADLGGPGLDAALWARPTWLPGYLALLPYNPGVLVIAPLDAPPGLGPVGLGAQARFCALGLLASVDRPAVDRRRFWSDRGRRRVRGRPGVRHRW